MTMQVDDEVSIVVTAAAASRRERVWAILVAATDEWWSEPYLEPGAVPMRMDARLGGAVWSGDPVVDDGLDLHGTIRAFDPPERLEIGGVLVPGAYAGSISITIESTILGSEIRVEHQARGRIDASVEERISTGWSQLLARLTALADA